MQHFWAAGGMELHDTCSCHLAIHVYARFRELRVLMANMNLQTSSKSLENFMFQLFTFILRIKSIQIGKHIGDEYIAGRRCAREHLPKWVPCQRSSTVWLSGQPTSWRASSNLGWRRTWERTSYAPWKIWISAPGREPAVEAVAARGDVPAAPPGSHRRHGCPLHLSGTPPPSTAVGRAGWSRGRPFS